MPYLELTPELVGSGQNRMVLAMIETAMLWPHNDTKKSRAWEASRAQYIVDRELSRNQPTYPDDLKNLVQTLLSAPRLRDIQKDATRPYIYGMTAGMILYEMIGLSEVSSPIAQLTTIKKRIVANFGSTVPQQFRFSLSTVENTIWPHYRMVANFWAAYIAQVIRRQDTAFPCRLELVLEFLAYSEYFRLKGEKLRPKQSPSGTVLRPGLTLAVPHEISLPEINISWLKNKLN